MTRTAPGSLGRGRATTRPLTRVLLVSLLALLCVVAVPSAAQAHAQLISTTPADGAELATAPDAVTFTFDADLLPGANTVSINDANAISVFSTPVQPDGPSVTVPWPASLPAGVYQVAYRVVSADGHPVLGAITITIAGGEPAASSPAASVSPDEGTASSAATPSDRLTTAWPWAIAAGVIAVIGLLAAGVVIVRRRDRLEP